MHLDSWGWCRDPKCRPAAKEALQDPWLQGNSLERNQGQPLDATVVQRIQVHPSLPAPHPTPTFTQLVPPACLIYTIMPVKDVCSCLRNPTSAVLTH